MYDRSIKLYDEPHSPEILESFLKKETLNKGKFLTDAHHGSYYLQMRTIHQLKVASVLEIGPGENFVAHYLRTLGIQYDTMDIVESSKPTILGRLEDVNEVPYAEQWDLVCAFQMLEHSPYECFLANLKKMAVMSRKYVFISLPYSCFGLAIRFNLSLGQRRRISRQFSAYLPSFLRNRKYRDEYMKEFPWAVHYWEIGRKGFPLKRIVGDIENAGLRVIDKFRSDNPYHFFILAQKT